MTFVDACINRDGQWWYHAPGCHHLAGQDENGPIMPSGWTAQQIPNANKEQRHG